MTDELRPLWEKTDAHSKHISELQVQQAIHREMLNNQSAQITQITRDSSERHGELVTLISSHSKKVDHVLQEHYREQGARQYKRWVLPILISMLALAAGFGAIK